MPSKIKRLVSWWRVFRRLRVESWRLGPLLIVVCAMGWGWPKFGAGNYLRGSVIERGPWLTVEPAFGLLALSWQPHWDEEVVDIDPPWRATE